MHSVLSWTERREIKAFVPEEYWNLVAMLQDTEAKYAAFRAVCQLKKSGKSIGKDQADEAEAKVKASPFTVTKVKSGVTKQHAPAPFTTSSLQQDASNKYGMSSPETMLVAQHLYEGMDVGGDHIALITYIRTDSVRVSGGGSGQRPAVHKGYLRGKIRPRKAQPLRDQKRARRTRTRLSAP